MKRIAIRGLVTLGLIGGLLSAPSTAAAHGRHDDVVRLDVQILTADVPEPISDNSTFVIEGAGADICAMQGPG